MSIQATCDGCFRTYNVKDEFAGRRIKCPDCGATVQIPDPSAQPAVDEFGAVGDEFDDDFGDDFAAPPERPRGKKSRSSNKKSSVGMPVALVAGGVGVVLLLACCGGVFFALVGGGGGGPIAAAQRDTQLDAAMALRQVGETREESGSLGIFDQELDDTGEYFDQYPMVANRGEIFVIDLYSDDFDTYLIVRDENIDGGFQIDNDDAGIALDTGHSQLIFAAPRNGSYLAIPTSFEPGETGRYLLRIRELSGDADGGEVREESGTLEDGDEELVDSDNEYVDTFPISAEMGDVYVIDMNSNEFDTYLYITGPEGSDFEIHNDDFGDSSRSQITMLAPVSGEYSIRATSYMGGESGPYRLTIRKL